MQDNDVSTDAIKLDDLYGNPRLSENVWHINTASPVSYLETLDSVYEVSTSEALSFARVRSHCTPHNSLETIRLRSGEPIESIVGMLISLTAPGVLLPRAAPSRLLPESDALQAKLRQATALWGRELSYTFVANQLLSRNLPKTVLIGWLLEMFHYVRDFPEAIAHAASFASGPLAALLLRYSNEESGHESFVLRTLVNLGLTEREVVSSCPLVSTRLISLLFREVFEIEPASALLLASMVEASEGSDDDTAQAQQAIEQHYGLARGTLDPYFDHQRLDAALGHQQLFAGNLGLFQVCSLERLDLIVNRLHDIKHAFELQSEEIKAYYSNLDGKYFPRQPLAFSLL